MNKVTVLPDPTPESIALWLSQLDRKRIHEEGWREVNRRFHSIARAMRPYIREQYPDAADQEALFDGLTLGLMTMAHFADIDELAERLGTLEGTNRPHKQGKDTRIDR